MNTFPVLLGALCIYALAYRYYSAFLAAKAMALDDRRTTPAHAFKDGHNYVASPKWVLFGHHFAAIAGAGPLVGPTLAAQFGFAPGFLWLLIGAVLAGCVQDFTVLVASVRHRGRSLAEIARTEISPFAGLVAMIAVLFILLVTLAGLGIVVVNALANSPWGVFTIGATVPIALIMGIWMFRSHAGKITVTGPSIFGVVFLISAVIGGHWFAQTGAAGALTFTPHQITWLMMAYGFIASVLPVWLLLEPRDYLSTYVKLGTIAILIVGVFIVHPDIRFPAFTQFVHGGGPIIKGKLFPFLFVTIACGAISGFHSLVSSGTTPKMLDKETDARFIGYGAMLCESLVGLLALIAATSMHPGDYFAINTTSEVFAKLGLHTVNLDMFSREVGEKLAGRTGGAVSLAVGMAQIFKGLPGMDRLMAYWYHYAIMFEALFILTTVDTGTRVARYVLQELLGRVHKPFANNAWLPGSLIATTCVVGGLGIPDLYGKHFDHLAALRDRQSIARHHRARDHDHLPDQYGQGEIRAVYRHSHVFCRRDHRYRRNPIHPEHLLAAHVHAHAVVHGLSGFGADGDLHPGSGAGGIRRGPPLDRRPERRGTAGRGVRAAGHGQGRSENGLLLSDYCAGA